MAAVAILSGFLALMPFGSLSVADYLLSLSPSYSIASMAFFLVLFLRDASGKSVLGPAGLFFFAAWNVLISLPLFASTLGIIGPDLYALGFGFTPVFVIIAAVTVSLVLFRSRLAYIFVACIAAFDLGLLPSSNFFDYMTDGVLSVASSVVVLYYLLKKIKGAPAGDQPSHGRTGPM